MLSSSFDSGDREEFQKTLLDPSPTETTSASWSKESKRKLQIHLGLPWLLSLILLVTVILQWRLMRPMDCQQVTFWKDYEIEGARREVVPKLKEVNFTGGLKIQPGVGLYRDQHPDLPTYVGPPSPEIDAAWLKLIEPLDIFLTMDEAEVMGTEGMGIEPASGLPQGLHDLHCLNMVRKALSLDHYPEMKSEVLQIHLEHCIDAIRQSLMCSSDMTIIKEHWTEHKGPHGGMIGDFDNVHVCRDFDSIRAWVTSRDAYDDDVWPLVAERLRGSRRRA
ncbi:hypothetical protein DL98DRAFT_659645 [Cadophora sp. DSE1049]|nr:hypothetical protein DL98DRAFT_659645 [Cadophora sp. DSE1049]